MIKLMEEKFLWFLKHKDFPYYGTSKRQVQCNARVTRVELCVPI